MKRILLILGAIAAVAAAGVWFAAEESYVLKLKADVGTSMSVTPHGSIDFGHVYGQESRNGRITVAVNDKAKTDPNMIGLSYNISCNGPEAGTGVVTICNNLTISPRGVTKLEVGTGLPQSVTHSWTYLVPDCQDAHQKEPDKKEIACTQSTNLTQAGAISIERTDIQRNGGVKRAVCDKKSGLLIDAKTGVRLTEDTDGDTIPDSFIECTPF